MIDEHPLTRQARVMAARIFAANMVEASTADDWQDLPMHLRDELAEWCESYIDWQNEAPVIDHRATTDTQMNRVPVEKLIRDELAQRLHEFEHGVSENESPSDPCWTGWRPDADALMPIVLKWLARAWDEGARQGSRGVLPDAERARRNPYRRGWQP